MTLTPRSIELVLRTAEERDVEAVQRVAREAWETTARGVLGAADREELVGRLYERRTLLEDLGRHSSLFLVATVQDAVVGFAEFVFEGRAGEVARVAVRPDWQRRGVGSALLRRGLAAFVEADIEVVTSAIEPEDQGCRRLFERNGFEVANEPVEEFEDFDIDLAEYRRRLDDREVIAAAAAQATVWVNESRRVCPRCHRHVREPIEACPDCGITLLAEAPPRPEARMEDSPRLVTVVASSDQSRIAFVQAALESAGIRFSMQDGGAGEVVEVRVGDAQLSAAREVLDALEVEEVESGAEE